MHMLEALNLRSKYTNAAEDYGVRQPAVRIAHSVRKTKRQGISGENGWRPRPIEKVLGVQGQTQ